MLPCFAAIFTKVNNFYDFLFASHDYAALSEWDLFLTQLHSERPKWHTILAFLSAVG